jgi:hypothetical protein
MGGEKSSHERFAYTRRSAGESRAGALADQALRKLIRLHLQKYEQHLAEVQKELQPEQQYGISSAECHRRFMAGEIRDAADIMD